MPGSTDKTFYLETFGCQMNVNDSEKVAGLLQSQGYEPAASAQEADFVFLNTCAVRERASEKLFHSLGRLRARKLTDPDVLKASKFLQDLYPCFEDGAIGTAYVEGKADKDEIYSAILNSLSSVKREIDKASLAPAGRPLAIFVESDDTGFKFHAGYPLAAALEGKSSLSDSVKIGQTPSGKAMRFQHVGSYADIDATYDAITAYLDEKGIDAQDSFVEEYLNDVKDADDPSLEVNIYVLLK